MRAGRGDHVFLNHDAADIVAAETQTQLAGLQARRYPGRLDVLDIVQVDTRDRQHLQVLDGCRFLLHETAERGVLALEWPRNESGEAAGLLLQVAHEIEM